MPPVQAPQPGDRIGPPPLADLLPGGMIIGWEVPDTMDERTARALQAWACGMTRDEACLQVSPPMTPLALSVAKNRHRDYFQLLCVRNDVILRQMANSGRYAAMRKVVDAALTLQAPTTWEETRTAMQVAQGFNALLATVSETPATTQRARAQVDKALKRLESMQRVEGASVKADATNNTAQVDIAPITADKPAESRNDAQRSALLTNENAT